MQSLSMANLHCRMSTGISLPQLHHLSTTMPLVDRPYMSMTNLQHQVSAQYAIPVAAGKQTPSPAGSIINLPAPVCYSPPHLVAADDVTTKYTFRAAPQVEIPLLTPTAISYNVPVTAPPVTQAARTLPNNQPASRSLTNLHAVNQPQSNLRTYTSMNNLATVQPTPEVWITPATPTSAEQFFSNGVVNADC